MTILDEWEKLQLQSQPSGFKTFEEFKAYYSPQTTLERIAMRLHGLNYNDCTIAEMQIARILIAEKYLVKDSNGDLLPWIEAKAEQLTVADIEYAQRNV